MKKKVEQKTEIRKTGVQYRTFTVADRAIDEDARTVEISFSSEAPVERYFGIEILDHSAGSVILDRMNNGGAFLVNHDTDDQVGVVESVVIDSADRVGRAVVKFGQSVRAKEIFQDITDGIRRSISVGYRIFEAVLESEIDGVDTYRVKRWEPLEISIVPVPADISVGVGRSETRAYETIFKREIVMENEDNTNTADRAGTPAQPAPVVDTAKIQADARAQAVKEANAMLALGAKHNKRDLAEKALAENKTLAEFRGILLDVIGDETPLETPTGEIGLNRGDAQRYSILNAIRAAHSKDWSKAGFELECSKAVADRTGRAARGFFLPSDVMSVKRDLSVLAQQRDLTVGSPTGGGNLVGTDHMDMDFITVLRNRMMIRTMGARVLAGLVGDVSFPRQTGSGTAYWVTEGGNTTESNQTFGTVALSPKTVSGRTDLTRKLLLQSSPSADMLVMDDLAAALALAIDLGAIAGSGSSGQPTGILNTSGIGDVAGGTNGLAPTWAHIVDLETEVSVDNADVGSLGYLTNSQVRGVMKKTTKVSGDAGAGFLWEKGGDYASGFGELNSYRAGVTNQVPSDLDKGTSSGVCSGIIFGNWSELLIGEWDVFDIKLDEITLGDSGGLVVRAFQDVDTGVRRAQSFSAMQDALTA